MASRRARWGNVRGGSRWRWQRRPCLVDVGLDAVLGDDLQMRTIRIENADECLTDSGVECEPIQAFARRDVQVPIREQRLGERQPGFRRGSAGVRRWHQGNRGGGPAHASAPQPFAMPRRPSVMRAEPEGHARVTITQCPACPTDAGAAAAQVLADGRVATSPSAPFALIFDLNIASPWVLHRSMQGHGQTIPWEIVHPGVLWKALNQRRMLEAAD